MYGVPRKQYGPCLCAPVEFGGFDHLGGAGRLIAAAEGCEQLQSGVGVRESQAIRIGVRAERGIAPPVGFVRGVHLADEAAGLGKVCLAGPCPLIEQITLEFEVTWLIEGGDIAEPADAGAFGVARSCKQIVMHPAAGLPIGGVDPPAQRVGLDRSVRQPTGPSYFGALA